MKFACRYAKVDDLTILLSLVTDDTLRRQSERRYVPDHLTCVHDLQGAWRELTEGIRMRKDCRGQGFRGEMFEWVIRRPAKRRWVTVQLTSEKRRCDARRFYERRGLVVYHKGFKRRR